MIPISVTGNHTKKISLANTRKTKERWEILAVAAAAVVLLHFILSKATFLNTDTAQ